MNSGVAIHSDAAPDHKRFFLSLAGALVIASLGFATVFYSFAWLPYQTLTWLDTLPPAKAAHTLRMMTISARTLSLLAGVFTSTILLAIVARRRKSNPRKQRSQPRHPIKLTSKSVREL